MSSGPVGLDVREYAYGSFMLALSAPGFYQVQAANNWLVTRVQFYTGANAGALILTQPFSIPVAVNGCLILEPNGAHRGPVNVSGVGGLLIVEYWFQASTQLLAGVPIVVVPP